MPRQFGGPPEQALPDITTPPSRFIGRKPYLDDLDHSLQETRSGQLRIVLVQGDAGVGKTRLLQEIQALALRNEEIHVCFGRFYEDFSLPYLPFIESLFKHIDQLTQPEQDAFQEVFQEDKEVIRQFLHGSDRLSPQSPSVSPTADQDKVRLFLAVARATIGLAENKPLLLILDDLHWADQSSLDLFSYLVFAVADAALRVSIPLLILGAYRPVEPEDRFARALARFQQEQPCRSVHLSGLSKPEIRELLQDLGIARPSQQLVTTVNQATQGNPLFVQEVLHHLVTQDALQEQAGYMVTIANPAELRLPTQVTTAITDRLQGLSDRCRKVLTVASVLGARFSLTLLSRVTDLSEEDVLELLEEGISQRLITGEERSFQFAHPVIHYVFYTSTSVARRERTHLRIASTLQQLQQADTDASLFEIAHHLTHAGAAAQAENTLHYARLAGDKAFAVFAWADAARYYEAALAAAASGCHFSAHEQATLHYEAGLAHYRNMDAGPCLDQYEKAIVAYRELGDRRGLARVLIEKIRAQGTLAAISVGTLAEVEPLEAVLKALQENDATLHGRILSTLSQAHWHANQPEKAIGLAREALGIARSIPDDRLCAEACHSLALAQSLSMQLSHAHESWQTALRYAKRAGDLLLQGWPLARLPSIRILLGRLDAAESIALEACEVIRKTQDWGNYSVSLATLALIAVSRGEFEKGERYTAEAIKMMHRSHYPWGGLISLPAFMHACSVRGLWTQANNALESLVEPGCVFTEAGPSVTTLAWLYRLLLCSAAGECDEVRAQVAADPLGVLATRRFDLHPLDCWCAVVEIGQCINTPELVEQPYDVLLNATHQGAVFSSGWGFLLPRILGIAATLRRDWEAAETHFQTAIETARQAGARLELGQTYRDYAQMLTVREPGQPTSQVHELQQLAQSIFNQLELRVPVSKNGVKTPPATLSLPMQTPVASHTQDGLSDKQAALLRQSPLTILFTDVAGSTALMNRLGDIKAREVLSRHDATTREYLHAYEGTEINFTGDGFMTAFSSASNAIACAIALQKAFTKYSQESPDTPIRIRVGINIGEPIFENGQLFLGFYLM